MQVKKRRESGVKAEKEQEEDEAIDP